MSRCKRRPLTFLAVVGAVLVTAACGSHSESPVAPSGLESSATINGIVRTGVGASSSGRQADASAAGIRVSIEGTGLSATTDQAGRFVISGAPTGSATLRFEGAGIDARLKLSGLVAGQVLAIEVQVSGGRAVLAGSADDSPSPSPSPSPSASPSPGDDDEEDEFQGAVESISPPDLTVAGRLVHTDAGTDIKKHGDHITLADIQVGDLVEVEGALQADGSVMARKIRVENDQNEDGDDGEDQDDEDEDGDGDNGGGNSGHGGSGGGGGDGDDDGHN